MRKTVVFLKGLWEENPVFRLLLGMCPTLAVTGYVSNAIAMGGAVIFVLVSSSFIISLFRRYIPHEVRIPVFVVIIATFATLADYYLRANFPLISKRLGPYVPLIVVNCIILGRQEVFSSRNPVLLSILDALGMSIGFTVSLLILSSIREVLGSGTFLGYPVTGEFFLPWLIMALPPGAFLTLGVLLGVINHFERKRRCG